MPSNNSIQNIKVGDSIAISMGNNRWDNNVPYVTMRILTVVSIGKAQATCKSNEIAPPTRIRLSDGKVLGEKFAYAELATDEILLKNKRERELLARYREANIAISDLINVPLHKLKLSVPQMEALGKAWQALKLMA